MKNLDGAEDISPGLSTDDIFRTSYGVAHHWRSGYYFPDSYTLSKLNGPFTCDKRPGNEVNPRDHYETTNKVTYEGKVPTELERPDLYHERAPPLSKLQYIKDFRSRYIAGGYRRPLSPSHQKSETHEAYEPVNGPSELWRPLSYQPFNLENHHRDGPSQRIIASTRNPKLAGRLLDPKHHEIFRYMDPYLSTTMNDYRPWDPNELKSYPQKDIATTWDLQEVPKKPGTGLADNPVPKDGVKRDRQPMRDKMIFKEATDITQVRSLAFPVPHSGFETLYQFDYKEPSSALRREDKLCPVETPFLLPDPGSKGTFAVPSMYRTEYANIGECHRTLL